MPLEEPTLRLAELLRDELAALEARHGTRISRGESVSLDSVGRFATWETRSGDVATRNYVEVVAVWARADRILRWGWVGRGDDGPLHVEAVEREGRARGAPQLARSVVGDVDRGDAERLARLGAVLCGAEGVFVREREDEVEFLGFFDRPRPVGRFSLPPPPRHALYTPKAISRPSRTPPPAPTIVEREQLVPVSNAAVARLLRTSPGYQQGLLLVVRTATAPSVVLVAVDRTGALVSVEPGSQLVEASHAFATNAAFQRITARIVPRADGGASIQVDVT